MDLSLPNPMLKYLTPLDWLPTAEDLPDCDSTPVDSELQEFIPSFLKALLIEAWADRHDWFFGIDMGVYYSPDEPAIVPDGFLALGVDRIKSENLRLSYVLWEEQVLPKLVLEVVSKKYRGEYSTKKAFYESLGVLYYVVYNPRRKRKAPLEVYKLIQGSYVQMVGNPVWFPELQIGIGRERYNYGGYDRDWLFWYDEQNQRYLTTRERMDIERVRAEEERVRAEEERVRAEEERIRAEEERVRAEEERVRADSAEERAQRLAERLRSLGVNPDEIE